MRAIAKSSFDNFSAKIHFCYGENPRILDASDKALAMLGVAVPVSADDRKSALRLIECSSMHSLETIALMCERERNSVDEECRAALQGVFLRKTDGSYVDIISWVCCRTTDEGHECFIDFVEDPKFETVEMPNVEDRFACFASRIFDIVFTIDYKEKTAVCGGTLPGKALKIPVDIPMHIPDAFELWIRSSLDESDWDRARDFLDLNNMPQFGETREDSFLVYCHGTRIAFDAMLVGRNCGSLILIQRAEGQQIASAPVTDSQIEHPEVFIRTFGHFDVFVDGQAIPFSSEKAKEYLALLVDRRGGCVSSREAAVNLFESVDKASYAKCRKAAFYMGKALQQHGIEDIVESVGGSRRLVLGKVRCDLFEYFDSDLKERQLMFNGTYMNEYSWGETTKGEITFY